MIKQWLGICVAMAVLTACSQNDGGQQTVARVPQPVVCNGPVVEITGQEPHYETLIPSVNQDYQRDGKRYTIVQNPANFTQSGLAAIYDAEPSSDITSSGEMFDPSALTAAHPTLPIPSYARITNLANGRMLVVKINDRGPYGNDRVISLSRGAADRLNTSNNTRVKIDPIIVAPDGTLSGPGMACVTIARQTYALPARPDLDGGMGSATSSTTQASASASNIMPVSNTTLQPAGNAEGHVPQGGFLGAPTPLRSGVLEEETSTATGNSSAAPEVTPAAPQTAMPVRSTSTASPTVHTTTSASGKFMVQVSAVSDSARAQALLARLEHQMSTRGIVEQNGAIYRIQLGPFTDRNEAKTLQQRLLSEAQMNSFITSAPSH